mmetsp:Transcript_21620/g.47266  ORF Transcript_21620/g.47266 Transcript_21620/m.47266 type:complete len:459 (-) Transcript_21620:44-1420(-)
MRVSMARLDGALCEHGVGHLDEASDVGGGLVVVRLEAVGGDGLGARGVNARHDVIELLVNLLARPRQTDRVLGHLEARDGDAAGVGRLCRAVDDAARHKVLDGRRGERHVSALGDDLDALVGGKHGGRVVLVHLVLRGARQHHEGIGVKLPDRLGALDVAAAVGRELRKALALLELKRHQRGAGLSRDAVLEVAAAARVGDGDWDGAHVEALLHREERDVARARDDHTLATQVRAQSRGDDLLGEVDQAVASRLGPDQAPAERESLAGEHARELVAQLLVVAKHVADLTATNIDVTSRHVSVRANVLAKLGHESLAEAHHLAIAAAARVKVRAALATTHWQRGQRVLEDLLEPEELQHRLRDGRVEAEATLVRTDGARKLHTPAAVDHRLEVISHPPHTEGNDTLWLDDCGKDSAVLRTLGEHWFERVQDLLNSLMKLGLIRVALVHLLDHGCDDLLR